MEITDNEIFQCERCNRIFSSKWNLKVHLEKKNKCVTPDESKYQCDECGKEFNRKSHLDNHNNKKKLCVSKEKLTNILKQQIQETLQSELQSLSFKANESSENAVDTNSTINNANSNNMTNSNNTNTMTNSNNTNNTNTMNNMNNTCLINYVVAQYPNAKNIEDCIKLENIPKMTLTECEDLYFTDGAMKIFKGLCDLGEENRPIHCTDASRCNYIYKSNDVWKIDVGGEAIRNHFFPVIQEAYTQVHKNRIKNNPGNSTIIGNYLTEMTGTNVKKICQKTLKRLSNNFLAKNSKNSKLIKMQ
jgi:Zinc finger, C2H2 type